MKIILHVNAKKKNVFVIEKNVVFVQKNLNFLGIQVLEKFIN